MIPLTLSAQSNSLSMRPCGCRYSTGGNYKGVCGLRVSAAPGSGKPMAVLTPPRGEVLFLF
jgi:hypothetical protein